jgi:transcriptional regulator with XRE-family HTH domain
MDKGSMGKETTEMTDYINKIRQARLDYQQRQGRVVSVKEVADTVGISRPALSQIENGRAAPSLDTLGRLCRFYGVQINDLVEFEPEPEPVAA